MPTTTLFAPAILLTVNGRDGEGHAASHPLLLVGKPRLGPRKLARFPETTPPVSATMAPDSGDPHGEDQSS